MSVTSYDGSFSFKQDSLARLGRREESKMSADQYKAFQNSPFMQKVQMTEDLCWKFTSSRDEKRMKTDPAFKPQDSDFSGPKAHEYDKAVNYYKVLGIEEFATLEEVKKSYKKLSLVYHPDKTAGLSQEQKDEYAEIFIELKSAYLTLGDQATRRQYDRDRDKDLAAYEVNGFKIKQKAHFDATEVMKKLQEMQRPPGRTIDVPIMAKLEKFFYGGHKAIKRQRMTKSGQEMRLYRVDIPRGAAEPHECTFRRQGDYHVDTQPDSINFKIKSKPHEFVERLGDNLQLRRQVELGREVFGEPFLTAQTPSLRGRHLLLWGRNPFYRLAGAGAAALRVTLRGEGLTPSGSLRFDCRVAGAASGLCTSSSAGSTQPARSSASKAADGTVPVTVRHMQTGGKLCLRLKEDTTMGEIRSKITTVLGLQRGSSVRLLYQYNGGYTPFPDRQALGDLRELHCAGTAWTGIVFTAEKAKQFLQEVIAISETEAFQGTLAAARAAPEPESELWGALAHILPEYGCEPTVEVMEEKISDSLALVEKLPEAAYLREKIEALKAAARTAQSGAAAPAGASAAGPRGAAHASLKRFLMRHELGPPDGIEAPGSDSEAEEQKGESGALRHGEGGLCAAPAVLRRASRRLKRELACEVVLAPVGDSITLFTKPTCQITFYSNVQQPRTPAPGMLDVPPMFAVSISSPPCAKRMASREWDVLKASLVPALQVTSFHLLEAARQLLPRAISDFAQGWTAAEEGAQGQEEADDGLFDEERVRLLAEAHSSDAEPRREELLAHCRERREFQRRQLALDKRANAHRGIPMPWKRLGDEAFRAGDFFTATRRYSQCLELLGTPEEEDRKQQAAVALSNRAACLAKVGHYEASLADARAALELRPRWGRAWGRVGTVALALQRGREAVEAYFKAVEYEPTPSNAEALQKAAVGAGDADAAHAEKEKGNTALRANDFGLAVAHYTLGIAALPPEEPQTEGGPEDPHAMLRSVLHSNRSAAFCRVKSWAAAVADAEKAVAAKDGFAKAYSRLGTALLGCRLVEKAYTAFAKAIRMESNNHAALKGRQACIAILPTWRSVTAQQRLRERFGADLKRPKGSVKVYCISDPHWDHKVNEEWTHRIDDFKFQEDVLIVAGNASDSKGGLVRGLTTLKSKFRRVFYIPGNHELWMTGSELSRYPDSLAKLLGIFEACDELGVDVFPAAVAQDVFIVPMLSWYHAEFDVVDPFPDPTGNPDKNCKWPMDADTQVWKYMLKLNEAHIRHPYHGTVITFSHFLPLQGLPHGSHNKMAKTMGCEEIDDQLRTIKVKSRAHVYGHSFRQHAQYDNGILYVNHYHGQEAGQEERAPLFLLYDGKGLVKKEVEIYDGPSRA